MKITADMCQLVIELMRKGKSEVQVAAALGLSKGRLSTLVESTEGLELKSAIEFGKTLHESYFEDLYQDAMIREINVKEGLVKAYMQNKFGWNEKNETTVVKTDIQSLTQEELNAQIASLEIETCSQNEISKKND